jgi:hypothetical protein
MSRLSMTCDLPQLANQHKVCFHEKLASSTQWRWEVASGSVIPSRNSLFPPGPFHIPSPELCPCMCSSGYQIGDFVEFTVGTFAECFVDSKREASNLARDLPLTLAHFSRSQSVPSGSNSPYQQHVESVIFPYRHDLP